MARTKTRPRDRRRAPPPVAAATDVKLISVPTLFGKRLAVAAEPPGTHQHLMRVAGRMRRLTVVAGTRGYGVRLYGDFVATIPGKIATVPGKTVSVLRSRIAFLPDPITREAVAAYRALPPPQGKALTYLELDCDVWAIADPAEPSGYRLIAIGTAAAPVDPLESLLRLSAARPVLQPE